jgi:hypothetical protein
MTTPADPGGLEQLTDSVAKVTQAMHEATRLLRSLAPAMEELGNLQKAAEKWPMPPPTEPYAMITAVETAKPHADSLSARAWRDRYTAPVQSAQAERGDQSVLLTIARVDGPLNPWYLRTELAGLPGVTDVVVQPVDSGRLSITLATERPPHELPVLNVLSAMFPGMVQGDWKSERELIVLIGSPGSHRGSWSSHPASDGVGDAVAPSARTRRGDRQGPGYDPDTIREPEGSAPAAEAHVSQAALSNSVADSGRTVDNRQRRWQLWRRSSSPPVS